VLGLLLASLAVALLAAPQASAEVERRACSCQHQAAGAVSEELVSGVAPPILLERFVLLPDLGGAVACGPRLIAEQVLVDRILVAEATLGLDVDLAIVFSAAPTGCGDLFYIPVKNDVLGIGYAHTDGVQLFDRRPSSQLQGVAFLNDLPYWQEHPEELRTAFLHEIGHRYLARVGARLGEQELVLTGREGGHWSYFLDTGGSPLEGNRFETRTPPLANTPALRLQYSPLDLYLMGLIAPEEVGELRLLTDATAPRADCRGHDVSAASPPQSCEPMPLDGSFAHFTVDAVIAGEGQRVPSVKDSPKALSVAAFVLGGGADFQVDSCRAFPGLLEARLLDFELATGSRMRLTNQVEMGLSCDEALEESASTHLTAEAGCSVPPRPGSTRSGWSLFLALSVLGLSRLWTRGGSMQVR